MSPNKLTDAEARQLLEMAKKSIVQKINFPNRGDTEVFDVVGDTKNDVFIIQIYRGKIRPFKHEIGARFRKNETMLLELHVSPSKVHRNPDGEKIIGSHWHIYTEDYGRTYAFPAEDIREDNFVDNTIAFLTKFNVVEQPNINCQLELL